MTNSLAGTYLRLRSPEPEDLEILYEWENNLEFWPVSETLSPMSKFILKKYLANAHKDIYEMKQVRFMIDLIADNSSIGTIDLYDFDPFHRRAAVGILIADVVRRRNGYALEALQLLTHYTFSILKLHQIYCHISEENRPSIELFQRAGFLITAERKEWQWNGKTYMNQLLLQLINPDHEKQEFHLEN